MSEVGLSGRLSIEVRDRGGRLRDQRIITNTVKTAGKNMAADQMLASPTLTKPTHMGIGEGTPGATALGSEIDRNALNSPKTRVDNVVTMVGFWDAGDGTSTGITEAGVFDAASSGNMHLSAVVSPSVVKGVGDTLTITWTLTFG